MHQTLKGAQAYGSLSKLCIRPHITVPSGLASWLTAVPALGPYWPLPENHSHKSNKAGLLPAPWRLHFVSINTNSKSRGPPMLPEPQGGTVCLLCTKSGSGRLTQAPKGRISPEKGFYCAAGTSRRLQKPSAMPPTLEWPHTMLQAPLIPLLAYLNPSPGPLTYHPSSGGPTSFITWHWPPGHPTCCLRAHCFHLPCCLLKFALEWPGRGNQSGTQV